jgi:hypothetical protein
MEEEVKDQTIENQNPTSKKDAFMQRFSEKYPDLKPDDEESLYGKISEDYDRFDKSDQAQKQLGDLLASDPRSAEFLMIMRKGGNPVEFLIEQYGDDFREALNDEGKAKELADAFSKYTEKQTQNRELQSKAEGNMQKMINDLDAAQKEGNFTDEDATSAYEYLYGDGGLLDRIITNEITKEDWLMLMKASKYDNMMKENEAKIAEAKTEGEIAGRNANIDDKKKKRTKVEGMPTTLASAGGSTNEGKPKNATLAALDKIQKKSVWD